MIQEDFVSTGKARREPIRFTRGSVSRDLVVEASGSKVMIRLSYIFSCA